MTAPSHISRRVALGLAAPAALLALAACADATGSGSPASDGGGVAAATEPTTPRTMPEGKGSGEADGVFPRTVVHFAGETTIETEPARVVVISTGQMDALLTLGLVPVGSTAGDGGDLIPGYLAEAFAEQKAQLDEVTFVGSRVDPDLETIANLAPDLIVLNVAGKDDAETFVASASEIAPTVATQGTGLYWKQDLLLLADALGRTEQAQTWLDAFHADAAAAGEAVEGDPTVSFLRKNGDRTRVFGVASFSGSVAEDAGLSRPESQAFTDTTSVDISAEQLDQADADWILYGVQGGDETELTSLALWPALGAVAADHAVEVDDDAFYLNTGPTAARHVLATLQETLA
ncbi:ABC transporter substrate-binding protein [Brachybacterium sp. NBEC-018]|uniref:ABC transporter substrate-binding protein n=1 Tax=Brachybacterium sp. NBEC-018 TaxID=2996004 RepID=UPI002174FF95|nr:ABC transporter substrate-binding protein [Brachybacterium sp. NBEC-018]UVY83957.1 ABC transporter substrate-binding protein [Brachybacterium sp. NBEC-018]